MALSWTRVLCFAFGLLALTAAAEALKSQQSDNILAVEQAGLLQADGSLSAMENVPTFSFIEPQYEMSDAPLDKDCACMEQKVCKMPDEE